MERRTWQELDLFFHSKQSQRTAFIHRQQLHFISPHCERIILPKSFAIVIVSPLVIDSLNTLTFSFILLPTFGYFIVPSRLDSSSSFSLLAQKILIYCVCLTDSLGFSLAPREASSPFRGGIGAFQFV